MKKMMGTIGIMLIILSMIGVAFAETAYPANTIKLQPTSYESGDATALSFISGVSDTNMIGGYYIYGKGFWRWPDSVGTKCEVNQFIVPIVCHDSTNQDCKRVFTQDYKKDSVNDLLPISNWFGADWFKNMEGWSPYTGYYCKASNEPITTKPAGAFTNTLTIPRTAEGGETVLIKGFYKVTSPGRFMIEASIDPRSRSLAVVTSSSQSQCDGSSYWAGSWINGVIGQTYEFRYTVKAPTEPGNYNVHVEAVTGCYKDGGERITAIDGSIEIKEASCGWQFWKACTQEQIRATCGESDQDRDGVPDGCDYCPKDFGVIQEANGCHPCFGMDPRADATTQCYKTYADDYGIPDDIAGLVNPVVSQTYGCDGNKLQTYQERLLTGTEIIDVQDCGSAVCEELSKTVFTCTAPDRKYISSYFACRDGDVAEIREYNDGWTDLGDIEECLEGCQQGECTVTDTCSGTTCSSGNTDVIIDDAECSTDQDCTGGSYCDSRSCLEPENWCSTNLDCSGTQECLGGFCIDVSLGFIECEVPEDCEFFEGYVEGSSECVNNICINPVTLDTETDQEDIACTEDQTSTCETGGSAITGLCLNGVLVSTGTTCLSDTGSNPLAGLGSGISLSGGVQTGTLITKIIESPKENPQYFYGAIGLLILGIGLSAYVWKPKKKKR